MSSKEKKFMSQFAIMLSGVGVRGLVDVFTIVVVAVIVVAVVNVVFVMLLESEKPLELSYMYLLKLLLWVFEKPPMF